MARTKASKRQTVVRRLSNQSRDEESLLSINKVSTNSENEGDRKAGCVLTVQCDKPTFKEWHDLKKRSGHLSNLQFLKFLLTMAAGEGTQAEKTDLKLLPSRSCKIKPVKAVKKKVELSRAANESDDLQFSIPLEQPIGIFTPVHQKLEAISAECSDLAWDHLYSATMEIGCRSDRSRTEPIIAELKKTKSEEPGAKRRSTRTKAKLLLKPKKAKRVDKIPKLKVKVDVELKKKTNLRTVKVYGCPLCPDTGPSKKSLEEHFTVKHPDIASHEMCLLCEYTCVENGDNLYGHYLDHSPQLKQCYKCKLSFSFLKQVNKHVCDPGSNQLYPRHVCFVVNAKTIFPCVVCGQQAKSERKLELHMRRHDNHRPAQCHECGKQFYDQMSLRHHKYSAHVDHNVPCYECGKAFRNAQLLRMHQRGVHEKFRPFICEICGKAFPQRNKLANHKRTHTGERPFMCAQCGKAFRREDNLRDHLKLHDKKLTKDLLSSAVNLQCADCGLLCFSVAGLANHRQSQHPGKGGGNALDSDEGKENELMQESLMCDVCGLQSSSPRGLLIHRRALHSELYPAPVKRRSDSPASPNPSTRRPRKSHPCTDCVKVYSNPSGLSFHRAMYHSNEETARMVKCPFCDKQFKHTSLLWSHKALVHLKRKKECPQCGKICSYASYHTHKLTHAGLKFNCTICGREFGQKRHLFRHSKLHAASGAIAASGRTNTSVSVRAIEAPLAYQTDNAMGGGENPVSFDNVSVKTVGIVIVPSVMSDMKGDFDAGLMVDLNSESTGIPTYENL